MRVIFNSFFSSHIQSANPDGPVFKLNPKSNLYLSCPYNDRWLLASMFAPHIVQLCLRKPSVPWIKVYILLALFYQWLPFKSQFLSTVFKVLSHLVSLWPLLLHFQLDFPPLSDLHLYWLFLEHAKHGPVSKHSCLLCSLSRTLSPRLSNSLISLIYSGPHIASSNRPLVAKNGNPHPSLFAHIVLFLFLWLFHIMQYIFIDLSLSVSHSSVDSMKKKGLDLLLSLLYLQYPRHMVDIQ